jgi:PAS domain S-box-containing protein
VLGIDETQRVTGLQMLTKVHPDDRERLKASIAELSPDEPNLLISYRMLRPDGALMWVERTSRAHFDEQGRMLRIVGMVTDITQRKLAEEALASVGRRLIGAQEQERTRIARELHDDIGQRLSLLTIELDQLHKGLFDLSDVRSRIGELWKQTSELTSDIHSLSHELHSSKLEHLGVAAAIREFCREFGQQQNAEVDVETHDFSGLLPPDNALCLFRVLQEALHNSAKHSGVRHFEVRLWGTPGEVHLTVSDSGVGFNSEAARESRGLGLISMEERLKLVNGSLLIDSQPEHGTTIHARVPLSTASAAMRVAG